MADLAPVGGCGWAPVQDLIAAREIYARDGNDDAVQAVDDALADLGFTA